MSKLSFRARALDASKPLAIYHARDVPDLSDYQAINRTVPQMPTGMEKEEETERHLQEVILAQQTNCRHEVYIPTPEVAVDVAHYEHIYQKILNRQSQYIRVPGLGLEEEVPDYDLDTEDDEWLNAQTKERPLSPLHFERMMDKLERGSGNTVLSVREAQSLLKDEEDLVIAVYDYWLAKRLRLGRSLIPTVKHERRDGTSSSNPYLAFRKRTEKMQTRKNRKNDETAYMQMLKLKRDLAKSRNLAEYVMEREERKHKLAKIEADIFRQRYLLEDWSGSIMSSLRPISTRSDVSRHMSTTGDSWDARPTLVKMESEDVQMVGRQPVLVSSGLKRKSKKKKFYFPPGTPEPEPVVPVTPEKPVKEAPQGTVVEKSDDEDPDGVFTFRRKPHVRYHKVLHPDSSGWDLAAGVPMGQPANRKRHRYSCTGFGGSYIGSARRRLGRGGRVLWDRLHGSESEGDEEEEFSPLTMAENKENESVDSRLKRCRFISRSPSPTSNFEFQSLPLIENPDPSSSPADPVTTMAIFEFGGFTSDSEFPEDASSFSTLPTSQFALKPSSSSDAECDPNSSQDEKMDTSVPLPSLLDRNSGVQQAGRHDPRIAPGRAALFVDRTNPSGAAMAAMSTKALSKIIAPVNNLKLKPPPSEHVRRQQLHTAPRKNPPTLSTPLQNSQTSSMTPVRIPPPPTPPSPAPSLAPSSSIAKQTPPPLPDTNRTSLLNADSKRITLSPAAQSGNVKSSADLLKEKPEAGQHQQNAVEPRDKASLLSRPPQQGLKSSIPDQNGSPKPSQASVNNSGVSVSSNVQSDSNPNLKSDRKPTQNGPTNPQPSLQTEPTAGVTPPSSWLMDGPAENVLVLNTRKPPQPNSSHNNCKTTSVTDIATAVTSQFLQNSIKEENGSQIRISEQLPVALPVARAVPIALNRELHLPMVQGTIPMTSSRLPTSLPPTPIIPKLEGHPQLVSAQSLVARRASTNGSNYPEIFHTATAARRLSETGLKQALAGINHSSLIDSATNSLVQPRANPSEVT